MEIQAGLLLNEHFRRITHFPHFKQCLKTHEETQRTGQVSTTCVARDKNNFFFSPPLSRHTCSLTIGSYMLFMRSLPRYKLVCFFLLSFLFWKLFITCYAGFRSQGQVLDKELLSEKEPTVCLWSLLVQERKCRVLHLRRNNLHRAPVQARGWPAGR